MPPPTKPADDEAHQALLNELDIGIIPKPFRNAHWKPSQRRNKNIKQIISENSRKEASVLATQANSGATTPFTTATDGSQTPADAGPAPSGNKAPNLAQASQNLSTMVLEKNARAFATGPSVTYTNIESAPSLSAAHQRHYCDLTGLPGPYTDPKTRLRYHDKELFGGGSYGIEINESSGVERSRAEQCKRMPLLFALYEITYDNLQGQAQESAPAYS
ncbi:unnamed protein product [Penicillium manginii]